MTATRFPLRNRQIIAAMMRQDLPVRGTHTGGPFALAPGAAPVLGPTLGSTQHT